MGVVGDPTLQIGLSLLVPFASYAIADEAHGSESSPCSPPRCSWPNTPATPTT